MNSDSDKTLNSPLSIVTLPIRRSTLSIVTLPIRRFSLSAILPNYK
ncbi:MAG: hypothetical protein ACTSQJ_02880 [Promethearchaeota archaeon]